MRACLATVCFQVGLHLKVENQRENIIVRLIINLTENCFRIQKVISVLLYSLFLQIFFRIHLIILRTFDVNENNVNEIPM